MSKSSLSHLNQSVNCEANNSSEWGKPIGVYETVYTTGQQWLMCSTVGMLAGRKAIPGHLANQNDVCTWMTSQLKFVMSRSSAKVKPVDGAAPLNFPRDILKCSWSYTRSSLSSWIFFNLFILFVKAKQNFSVTLFIYTHKIIYFIIWFKSVSKKLSK